MSKEFLWISHLGIGHLEDKKENEGSIKMDIRRKDSEGRSWMGIAKVIVIWQALMLAI